MYTSRKDYRSEFWIDIRTEQKEQRHIHTELELVYVLDGFCQVEVEQNIWQIEKDDLILINANQEHMVSSPPNCMLAVITFSYFSICSHLKEDFILFKCNTKMDYGYKYTRLRQILQDVLLEYASGYEGYSYRQQGLFYLLVDRLVEDFKVDGHTMEKQQGWEQSQRLSYILNYVEMNYADPISLTDIAEKLYLSPSSISRFFVKRMGESFVTYVKKVRLKNVVEALVYSDVPITRIAVENGFSNPSAMNKDFREVYGITPTEYRKKNQTQDKDREKEKEQTCRQKLQKILDIQKKSQIYGDTEDKIIHENVREGEPYRKWETKILNVGALSELESASLQKHVLFLKERLHTTYIRLWSPFSENMMLQQENGKTPSFEKLDRILDFCVENGLKVFFDLGQRTNLAMSSERNYLFRQESGMEFESKQAWEFLLGRFIRHMVRRYGEKEVTSWIFEFSFFLNMRPYYISNSYSTRQVWESGYRIIKEILPETTVAGPDIPVWPDEDMVRQVVEHFLQSECVPDAFTMQIFPYVGQITGDDIFQKIPDVDYLQRQIGIVRQILHNQRFEGKLYITDWNNSIANRNFIQDSCYRGTYVLKSVLDNYDKVDAMGLWYASDLINVYYDSDAILSGSGGMLTKDGICKPVFWAFQFLANMGELCLGRGENYLITRNRNGDIQILCYNNKNLGANYFLVEENSHKPNELDKLFQNHEMLNLTFLLEHMKQGEYIIRQKIINEKTGSVLNKWIELGCERDMLPEDVYAVKRFSEPDIQIGRLLVTGGKMQLELHLAPHEMRWISIVNDR